MPRVPALTISAAVVLAFAGFAFAAETNPAGKWELQYFYDENESTLTLTDLKFPSPQRGIASGYITRRVSNALLGDHEKAIPVVLVTANGGKSLGPGGDERGCGFSILSQ